MSKKLKSFKNLIAKKSPELWLAFGIGGMLYGTFHVYKKSRKVNAAIDKAKKDISDIKSDETKTPEEKKNETRGVTVEAAVQVAKEYAPALMSTAAGICCITRSHKVMKTRLLAVSTACSGIDKAYTMYKKSALDTVGEKKEQEIVDNAAKAKMTPVPKDPDNIAVTGRGNVLCYDTLTDRYFRSDSESIRHALNNINNTMMLEGYVSLNDWYYELGMKGVGIGDDLGWRLDDGLITLPPFTTHMADNGEPCICVEYSRYPVLEFSDLY